MVETGTPALLRRHPGLEERLPWCSLGSWPTPVDVFDGAELGLNCRKLMVKRDDLSGVAYGGNKVRKLELLLADAAKRGCRGVITFGTAGSNHALATSVYAREVGLQSYSLLTRQAVTSAARRNLLAGLHHGSRLMGFDTEEEATAAARDLMRDTSNGPLALIPGGGSSPLGCIGFVSAALELEEQIAADDLPVPDVIYVPLGTTGTMTGLQLGLRIACLPTRMVAVRVVREDVADPDRWRRLDQGARRLLAASVPGIEDLPGVDDRLDVRHGYFGPGYARYTPEGMAAGARARRLLEIGLEGTYSGKAFAALLDDLDAGRLADAVVLFWNTYNSRPWPDEVRRLDYRSLPGFFHYYFEHPVQPLDPEATS